MEQPLNLMRQIMQDASEATSLRQLVDTLVSGVRHAVGADACTLYISQPDQSQLLAASSGLAGRAVGHVRLQSGEGITGHIAQTQQLKNLSCASDDEHFRFVPETGEAIYHAFLGVPLIHLRKTLGVISVQRRSHQRFSEAEVAFLITIATQLGGTLHTRLNLDHWIPNNAQSCQTLSGVRAVPGIAVGPLHFCDQPELRDVSDQTADDPALEQTRLLEAIAEVKEELKNAPARMQAELPSDIRSLFSVYRMLLESPELLAGCQPYLAQGLWAPAALREAIEELANRFAAMPDPYLSARAEDMRNLGNLIYTALIPREGVASYPDKPFILVGRTIDIATLSRYPLEKLAGVICQEGSVLSHIAVLANAVGLPTIMGVGALNRSDLNSTTAIIDGYHGRLLLHPPLAVFKEFRRLQKQQQQLICGLEKLRDLPAQTPDGQRVHLYTNTGLMADIRPGLERGAEGVGLYRSEIPFLISESFPTVDEQEAIYRKILEAYAPRPVAMRTLDIGGDKPLPYCPFKEENPSLGWRGIRFTLDNTQILQSQLTAMLKASRSLNNLRILLPMISRLDEIVSFKVILDAVLEQLEEDGYRITRPKIGIMIEVPAAILMLPLLAPEIDFISIGSNDLTQYILAVDRNNSRVSRLFDSLHPAVIQGIYQVAEEARRQKLPISLCGEMASDPCAVLLLLGMGINTLSLSAFNLPRIKWLIRSVPQTAARKILAKALRLPDEQAIRLMLQQELENFGLGELLEPVTRKQLQSQKTG